MNRPIIITIVGGSGSGKTVLTNAIEKMLGDNASTISHDMYYHPKDTFPSDLEIDFNGSKLFNFDHPDALETDLLVKHLLQLEEGNSVQIPEYNFAERSRMPGKIVHPKKFIIVEGIMTLSNKEIAKMSDLNIFVDVSDANLLARRLMRDWGNGPSRGDLGEVGMRDDILFYVKYVQYGYLRYVEPYKNRADLLLENNSWTSENETPKMVDIAISYIKGKYFY